MTEQTLTHPLDLETVEAFLGTAQQAHAEDGDGRGELTRLTDQYARLPAAPGSVVMVSLPHGIRTLQHFFALVLAGHTPVLLSPSTPARRLREIARGLGAYGLVRGRIRAGEYSAATVVDLAGTDLAVFADHPHERYAPGHAILMTSGTSGLTSGCLHSIDALLRNARRHCASIAQRPGDTVLVNLPVYYSFALVAQVLGSMITGSRLVVTGPPFSPDGYAAAVARHGVTVSSLTPALAKSVMGAGGRFPSPLRSLTIGGQAIAPAHVNRIIEADAGLGVYLTYGLTEAGPRVSTLPAHLVPPHRRGSVGRPLDGVEVLLREAGDGDQEVLVRSDTVYVQRVGDAAASRRGGLLEPGLVATGDIGHLDESGCLVIRGRSSEFTVIRGEKVCLATVRRAAESLPGVVRAVARGAEDDETAGLELDVYVDGAKALSEDRIHAALRSSLTLSERPGRLRVHPLAAGEFHK